MFLEKMKKLRTLTFKLISLHIVLYLCSFFVFMFITFFIFYNSTVNGENRIVKDEIQEVTGKARNGTFEDLMKTASEEILELGSTNLLIHIRYHGVNYYLPDRQAWKGYPRELPTPPTGQVISLASADGGSFLRIGAAVLPYGAVLHLGYNSRARQHLIEQFIDIFGVIFVPILLVGTVMGYFMVKRSLRDISLVRKTAVEIYRGNLESRVERSHNGDELDQLSEAFNIMLSRIRFLIRNMARMVDNLAHDLRSPLTRLKTNAEIALLSDKPVEFFKATLERSLDEYDRIIALINHVLSISEAENGLAPLRFEWVALGVFMESVYEFYSPLALDSDIVFELENTEDVSIRIDKARMWQGISNIVDNAFKFTGEKGSILLSAKAYGNGVMITVSDTGIGMEKKDLPYIFERFFKADKGRANQGYGLGLSLAKAVVALHGGTITVESTMGKGATFSILLPDRDCVNGRRITEESLS